MTVPVRRTPIALLLCYGFAGAIVGGHVGPAHAQSTPLRVDPVLLGLPPAKPVPPPAPAQPEPARVDVRPVEAPAPEARPLASPTPEAETVSPAAASKPGVAEPVAAPSPTSSPQERVERPQAPTSEPAPRTAERVPAPAPAPGPRSSVPGAPSAPVVPSAPAAPPPRSAPQPQPVAPQPVVSQPQPIPSPAPAPRAPTSAQAPLRVDPALLGLPPEAVAAQAARPATTYSAPVRPEARPAAPAGTRPQTLAAASGAALPAEPPQPWYRRAWDTATAPYDKGNWEFYLPLHTHHLRSKYTKEQIDSYQETPYGFGLGKGFYNEKGNWEGVYGLAFQDSHFKPMYMLGYGWKSVWNTSENTRFGLGYTAGLLSRTDINDYLPFPYILPIASFGYKNLSLEGTFIPGGQGNGNIFFIWAKWELGKPGEKIGTPAPKPEPQVQFAEARFGPAVPLAQRVPYGPEVAVTTVAGAATDGPGSAQPSVAASATAGVGSGLASGTQPPLVPATGRRDEVYVPDPTPALALRPAKGMTPPPKSSETPRPVFLSAYRMGGEVEREFSAEGDAELRKIGTVLNSDQLTYWPLEDEVEAQGNVRLQQGDDVVTGPRMRMKLEDQVGFFEQPAYTMKRVPQAGSQAAANKAFARSDAAQVASDEWFSSGFATPRVLDIKPGQGKIDPLKREKGATEARGEADRIDFEGENQVRLSNATYTTCMPGNNGWYARASKLKLDYDREVGEGEDATVYFQDVPILYSPWLSFSLNNERKSGFLAPSLGTNTDRGFEATIPYYWNIAPNMDATLVARTMSKRGTQLGSEFRYLNTAYGGVYRGEVNAEILPSDRERNGDQRYALSLKHLQSTSNGFTGQIDYTKVSDDDYNTDLSNNVVKTAQTQLLQRGLLTYGGGGWWSATANVQQYQTLQTDLKNPVLEQYRLLPQLTLNARRPDFFGTDASFMGQYTNFTKAKQVINGIPISDPDGKRTVLYPQLALPFETPGWYVTPKFGVNSTHYSLSGQKAETPDTITRNLPIFSVDSGMTFERTDKWFGRDYTQTLEPRLFYLNVPYKDQSLIPNFDTALADFNFAQIFSENQYTGWDRISNANQLTAALSSRLIEPTTGNEIFRAMVGQRYYFERNKVALNSATLPAADDDRWRRSDFLAAFSGQVLPRIYADFAWQYNLADREVQRFAVGGRYNPEPGKTFNAAYRYNRDPNAPVDQVDFSAQWPLSGKLYAVGRLNYSFRDDGSVLSTSGTQKGRFIETLGGLEYNGGCWVLRGVVQRLALKEDDASTSFFVQLELNDFSRIGSNPLKLLSRSVQGYSLINQPSADSSY